MRDAFITRLYELAKQDRDLIFVSADFGAPAFDKVRSEIPEHFVNVGIAEQNMISIASGLALEGKKAYAFAIAPFASSRCHEFTKLNAGLMKIPIKVVGVGAGFGYDDSGPTHHTTEDISIMRAIPNLKLVSPSFSRMAEAFAEISYKDNSPYYIRLDRKILPDLSEYYSMDNFQAGFKEVISGNDIAIISTGVMVHTALKVQKKLLEQGKRIGVIDLYRLKPVNPELKNILSKYKYVISLEEHLLDGGLGSIISEIITDNDLNIKLKRIGVTDYLYEYGREHIHSKYGLDADSVTKEIEKLF